jgi:hypothetical protein
MAMVMTMASDQRQALLVEHTFSFQRQCEASWKEVDAEEPNEENLPDCSQSSFLSGCE